MKAATETVTRAGDTTGISIHAAREGGDGEAAMILNRVLAFQSTPPVKAATPRNQGHLRAFAISIHAAREGGDFGVNLICAKLVISIHAAREGGDSSAYFNDGKLYISIHAAREGGDKLRPPKHRRKSSFQSTPPVKAATGFELDRPKPYIISIHAAREGGDAV